MDGQREREKERERDRQWDRRTEREGEREGEGQTVRRTDRQRGRKRVGEREGGRLRGAVSGNIRLRESRGSSVGFSLISCNCVQRHRSLLADRHLITFLRLLLSHSRAWRGCLASRVWSRTCLFIRLCQPWLFAINHHLKSDVWVITECHCVAICGECVFSSRQKTHTHTLTQMRHFKNYQRK